jgi:hypothetical protein
MSKFGVFKETTRGENTHAEKVGAKVRKGQARKAAAIVRVDSVDLKHSTKLDKRISNKAQKLAKREKKRAGLLY